MASTGVRRNAPFLPGGRLGRRFHRGLPSRPQSAEWIAVGVAALILGLVTARVASSRSSNVVLLLLAALIPFALMLARDVRRLLLLVVVFDTAFQWDKNFDYNDPAAQLGAMGGLSVSVTTIALFGLYLMWFAELMTRRASVPRSIFRASIPLGVYVAITALSTIVAGNKTLALFQVALLLQTFLVFIYIAGTVQTREDVRFLVTAIVACLFLESLVALTLPIMGGHKIIGLSTYASTSGSSAAGRGTRFGGTIGSPNTAAAFFSLLVAPTVALAVLAVSRRLKLLAAAAFGLATLALILTLSRGGWMAFVVSLTFLIVIGLKRGWISARIPVVVAIGMIVIVLPFSGRLTTRLTGNDNGSAASRIPLIHLASTVIRNHPVLGVGANQLALVFPKIAGPQYDRNFIYTVHNKYLLVWAEAGTGALVAFLWFLFSTLRRGWRVWRREDAFLSLLALGFTAGILGQMVHMSVEIFASRPQVQALWLVAGLLVAMENVAIREEGSEAGRRVGKPELTG